MVIDTQRQTDREDKPLTRTEVYKLLQEAGGSDRLILNDQNLRDIDLTNFDLKRAKLIRARISRAKLSGVDLNGVDLNGVDLSGADLIGANFNRADRFRAWLAGAKPSGVDPSGVIGLNEPKEATIGSTSTLNIRITEQPLTARNLATAIS